MKAMKHKWLWSSARNGRATCTNCGTKTKVQTRAAKRRAGKVRVQVYRHPVEDGWSEQLPPCTIASVSRLGFWGGKSTASVDGRGGDPSAYECVGDYDHILERVCREARCWGMFLSCGHDNAVEVAPAVPWLDPETLRRLVLDGCCYLLFVDEASMEAAYARTVGDDGPTPDNPYRGPVRVYALTCGPDGQCRNENT